MAPKQEAFAVSAPGKVIVVGEHAVVHGQAAIAAAISLRSYLVVSYADKTDNKHEDEEEVATIKLDFPDVQLHHSWPVFTLPWAAFNHASADLHHTQPRHHRPVTVLNPEHQNALEPHILSLPTRGYTEAQQAVHKSAATAFLYLLMCLRSLEEVSQERKCTYTLRSTIPIASGLGSSASISVCLATALLIQSGAVPLHPSPALTPSTTPEHKDEGLVETINAWAFVGELAIHGTPSGIDNTVSTRGSAVWFQRQPVPARPKVVPLKSFPTLPLLLVNTKRPRSTAREVAKVARLKERFPAVVEGILGAIGGVTGQVNDLATSEGFGGGTEKEKGEVMEELGELIRLNHQLLATLGVSHPDLEMVKSIVDGSDVGWTKLTGAGGGGCAFSLLKPGVAEKSLRLVEAGLYAAGFERYEVTLGGRGVGVLDLGKNAKSVAKPDVEGFRQLKSVDKVEAFIGISDISATREGWQFFD